MMSVGNAWLERRGSLSIDPEDVAPGPERIAVIDDEPALRRLLVAWLEQAGYVAMEFDGGAPALASIDTSTTVVCLDLGLDDIPGLDVLRRLRAREPDVPVVVITAKTKVEDIVEVMKAGAFDYLAKPIDALRFNQTIHRAAQHRAVVSRLRQLEDEIREPSLLERLAGQGRAMRQVARSIERVRNADVNVAIMGESGTGKEVVARAIHDAGSTQSGPFIAVNCASIPHSIQESELFGHEKGSFTGATGTHAGKFEQASGGTLFLDEIGEMAPATQASLLRVLQERTIVRLGGHLEIPVNARVMCATHRDLAAEVRAGRFREDLFFRLVVYPIRLPPLRERTEDLPALAGELLRRSRLAQDRGIRSLHADTLEALRRHPWPGNVRELDNVIQRACLSCEGSEIMVHHLPGEIRAPSTATPTRASASRERRAAATGLGQTLRDVEICAVQDALERCGGNVTAAAKLLGVSRTKLYRELKRSP